MTPLPTRPPASPRPYAAPALRPLGSVEAVTAGDRSGTLDQLVGSSGGFMDDGAS